MPRLWHCRRRPLMFLSPVEPINSRLLPHYHPSQGGEPDAWSLRPG